jgi:exoribonuclease R
MKGFLTTNDYKKFVVCKYTGEELARFEGAQNCPKGLPGDTVYWNEEAKVWSVHERGIQPPIVGVLELCSKTKYGMTSRGVPMYLFVPCHRKWPMMIVGCSHRDVSQNQLAVVNVVEWTTTGFPRANLVRLIGPSGDPVVEEEAIFLTYNPFKEKKEEALMDPVQQRKATWAAREPTPELTFNIDPPGCKDIDDVLSFKVDPETGLTELWITISDVAAFVDYHSSLDHFAFQQGATAYKNGEAVRPMFPRQYSEDAFSLLAGTSRFGVSLVLQYRNGKYSEPFNKRWCLSIVKNRHTFDYDTFVEKAAAHNIPVDILEAIASGILGTPTDDPHKWVEACMLCYNLEAAKVLRQAGQGILRKHDMADLEKLALYEVWGGSSLAVLANRSALYCHATDDAPTHWGLKATVYCHASSPIRRYADLVNQRVLKESILTVPVTQLKHPILIPWLNQRQKDLKSFERDTFFLKMLQASTKTTYALVVAKKSVENSVTDTTKYTLWLPAWNRLVSWKTSMPIPDSVVPSAYIQVSWFANPAKRRWKDALVFKFDKILEFKS